MLPTLQILWESARSTAMGQTSKEKLKRFRACEDKIVAQFGLEFVDELENAWDELHLAELDRAYQAGFLTAFQLWMEVSSATYR